MRKLLAVLLVVSMFATTLPAVAGSFPDLKTGHWANVHVESLAEMGVILGYPDGEFKGDRPATRLRASCGCAPRLAKNDRCIG